MKPIHPLGIVTLLIALSLAGCHQHAASSSDKQYDVKGKVIAVKPDEKKIELDHEDIPGLMKAMKMDFRVEDPKLLEGLSPGDTVQGRLQVKSGQYTLTELRRQ
jgi:Cu/Ag efflux protein CusF